MNGIEAIETPVFVSDGTLLSGFLTKRDDAAFAELVARHGPLVFGVCLRRLGQCADAEDAFQAVFLALANQADELAGRQALGPWLYTVARRISGKALRSRRRRRWLFWSRPPELPAAIPSEVDVDLDTALSSLSEDERSAIILCHMEGYSRSEAAKALRCPEGTLSARLSRGLEKLRRKLGKSPLAILAAATVVTLPEALPAMTVASVRHLRAGTLDDWASPQTVDLFRKAQPMNVVNRLGTLGVTFFAAAILFAGAAMGRQLRDVQPPSNEKESPPSSVDLPRQQKLGVKRASHEDAGGTSLAEAIGSFNREAGSDPIGKDQPKLTEDEVIAAVRAWATCAGQDAPKAPPQEYRMVAETRTLPKGAVIDSTNKLIGRGYSTDVWWIHLRIPQRPGGPIPTYSLRIRMQQIRSRPMTKEDAVFAATLEPTERIVYPLKKASAQPLVEALNRLMSVETDGTPNAFITADTAANAVIVVASKQRHKDIAKALQALDRPDK
jgi:RNA polymerase sigma factor (sigma-70 family)